MPESTALRGRGLNFSQRLSRSAIRVRQSLRIVTSSGVKRAAIRVSNAWAITQISTKAFWPADPAGLQRDLDGSTYVNHVELVLQAHGAGYACIAEQRMIETIQQGALQTPSCNWVITYGAGWKMRQVKASLTRLIRPSRPLPKQCLCFSRTTGVSRTP